MQITIEDLRAVCETLLTHLEDRGVESVELSVDYYWNVPHDSKYDPYHEPPELDLGQLSDDWRELRKVLDGSAEPLAYHLVWLAAILRAIGETLVA